MQYIAFYLFGFPLWTETIAEWIMAHTPSRYAVALLEALGPWAKPFAMTGGLAAMGFVMLLVYLAGSRARRIAASIAAAALLGWFFEYHSLIGQFAFWIPAMAVLLAPAVRPSPSRRQALVMLAGTAFVAVESFTRDRRLAHRATPTMDLSPAPPAVHRDEFGQGFVRKAVTPVGEFYAMSKNAVDPLLDPRTWRLRITENGRLLREISYAELLSVPRTGRFETLRCISNTLKSDLMGTAFWSGVHLSQLVDRRNISAAVREVAVIGVDGHGDSLPLDYAFAGDSLLALAMNGRTLNRNHGFPLRLLVPRYYGFKNVKWIGEIAFVSDPYFGTWPKMGYTKEPLIHTSSHIDRYVRAGGRIRLGGASFAGDRGIRAVQVRAGGNAWIDAVLEPPLSPYTLTRWYAEIPVDNVRVLQARAQDGAGRWQSEKETPLFPNGVDGPTVRSVS